MCDPSSTENAISGKDFTGALAGESVRVQGDYTVRGHDQVGGLIGLVQGNSLVIDITNFNSDVYGNDHVGGLIGSLTRSGVNDNRGNELSEIHGLSHSYVLKGEVGGNMNVGGLVEKVSGVGVVVNNSFTSNSVNPNLALGKRDKQNNVGGLVGFLEGGLVEDSFYIRAVVKGNRRVGGLVEISQDLPKNRRDLNLQGILRSFVFSSRVEGEEDVGGLVGVMKGVNNEITFSYYSGSTLEATEQNIGGLVGRMDGAKIKNNYARFKKLKGNGENVKRLVGHLTRDNNLTYSYAQGEIENHVGNYTNSDLHNAPITHDSIKYYPVSPKTEAITMPKNWTKSVWGIDTEPSDGLINDGFPYPKNNFLDPDVVPTADWNKNS